LVGTPRWPPLPGIRRGRVADAWQHLQSNDHRWISDFYAAAVGRFADRVDETADTELRQVQAESLWSLASATALAGLIGFASVVAWVVYLRTGRQRRPVAVEATGVKMLSQI